MNDITGFMACIAVLFLALVVYLQMWRIDFLQKQLDSYSDLQQAQMRHQFIMADAIFTLDKRTRT